MEVTAGPGPLHGRETQYHRACDGTHRAWRLRAEPVVGKGRGLEGRVDSAQDSRTIPVGNMHGCPCDWMGTRAGIPSSVGVSGFLGPLS